MGKKKIKDIEPDDEVETVVGSPDDSLIAHEFERSLENAYAEKGVVVLTLERATGHVSVDWSLSNVLEAWAMCAAGDTILHDMIEGSPTEVEPSDYED